MGFGGMGPLELMVVLAIVVMLFGTKRLRNLGGDLGTALKGFRSAMKDGENEQTQQHDDIQPAEVTHREAQPDATTAKK